MTLVASEEKEGRRAEGCDKFHPKFWRVTSNGIFLTDEDILPLDTTLCNSLAHSFLVTIRLCGVDVPVAGLQRLQNGGPRVVIPIHPQAEQWDRVLTEQPNRRLKRESHRGGMSSAAFTLRVPPSSLY